MSSQDRSAAIAVNLDAAREIAAEMQRGVVSTHIGNQHITHISKRGVTEAWKQAGQIIEALVKEVERDA